MIVVKVGGGAGINMDNVLQDLAVLEESWVLVHGASDETNRLQERLGTPPRFVTSVSGHTSRFTDADALDAFAMAAGKMNLRIVERLQQLGVNAVGLSGVSGRLLEGKRKDHVKAVEDGKRVILRGDFTGTVERVNAPLLQLLLGNGYCPVVTVPAISYDGDAVNVDGDRAAAAVAVALEADALVILSNVPGLLTDPEDASTLVRDVPLSRFTEAEAHAKGRFRKKMMGAREAVEQGVSRVVLATANVEHPVQRALKGEGTVIHS